LDAGYYSDANLLDIYKTGISFVARLKENNKNYKELVLKHASDFVIGNAKYATMFNGRLVYIKRIKCQLIDGGEGYAFVALDVSRKTDETIRLMHKHTTSENFKESLQKIKIKEFLFFYCHRRLKQLRFYRSIILMNKLNKYSIFVRIPQKMCL
jgi:hypothetical protein